MAADSPKKRAPADDLGETFISPPETESGGGSDLGETVVPDAAAANLDQTFVPSSSDDDSASAGNLGETVVGQNDTSVPEPPASEPAKKRKKKTVADEGKQNGGGAKKKKATQLGDFKLVKKLGQGGMGTVYLAKQLSLDRTVALKTLSKDLAKREDFVKRFHREAKSMAKLDHVNIVKVYAVAEVKGIHFAAIEFIDGKSVQDWIDKLGPLSIGDAIHITLSCAEGLLHAHELGMVHRDIKPDNILVTSKGIVKVADFGLAKAMDEDVSMTQSGTGLGTPLYMAPEQARSAKHVDQRSDIYALGATLYHLVTGALPFTGDSALDLIMAKETGKFSPARRLKPEVPEKLDLIIDRMLAKEPNHRYSSCADIISDLAALELESPHLTFIDGAAPPSGSARRAATATSMARTAATRPVMAATQSSLIEPDSREDARKKEEAGKPKEKIWFVAHKNAKGKSILSKWNTDQVMRAIKAGSIDPSCKAKDSPDSDFQPLAQFDEFMSALENQIVKKKAELKAGNMVDIYKQIDKADKRKKRWRWLKGLTEGTLGYVGLIFYLAFVVAVLYGFYLVMPVVFKWTADAIGLGAPPAPPPEVQAPAEPTPAPGP